DAGVEPAGEDDLHLKTGCEIDGGSAAGAGDSHQEKKGPQPLFGKKAYDSPNSGAGAHSPYSNSRGQRDRKACPAARSASVSAKRLEHSNVDSLDRFLAGKLAGAERDQIAAADAGDVGLGVRIEADARTHFVPPDADRQPLVGAHAERRAVIEQRVDDR